MMNFLIHIIINFTQLDLEGFWSIRINRQWRIIFQWIDNHSHDVQIVDYH